MEDFTAMKLIEEIVEYDQEIKMKQKWINSRMKMLHEIQKKHKLEKPQMKNIIGDFLQKIQPEYPEKLSVEYKRQGESAIPLAMKDVYPDAIAMKMADKHPVIALQGDQDFELINGRAPRKDSEPVIVET